MGAVTSNLEGGADSGKLQKLKIEVYTDPKYTPDSKLETVFETLINPEKYTQSYKVEYVVPDSSKGSGDNMPYYAYTPPSDLELEFLFDDTGVFDETPGFQVFKRRGSLGVEADIAQLVDLAYSVNGDIHRPNYLIVCWGSLRFHCVLGELNIEYKLFSHDGKPIRALAKAKFKNFVEPEKSAALKKVSSPDLTHARIVQEGDTLPLMTKRIYGDSKYYLEVARVNKLTTFRKLKTGQQLIFPPIQKPS